jgi:hypothetical protein
MLSLRRTWDTLLERRRYWLAPITVMLIAVGSLFLISAGGHLLSVIYPMF